MIKRARPADKAAAILKTEVDVTFIGDGESMDYLKKLTSDLGLEKMFTS